MQLSCVFALSSMPGVHAHIHRLKMKKLEKQCVYYKVYNKGFCLTGIIHPEQFKILFYFYL